MIENAAREILEHLRHIRGRVDLIAGDVGTLKLRTTSLESRIAGLHGGNAIAHQRMDRVEARLDRIAHRLDLLEKLA